MTLRIGCILTLFRRTVTEGDRELLNKRIGRLAQERRGFDRLTVSKETLQQLFAYNRYKLHAVSQLADGETATVYRSGTLVDISCGPHIPDTSVIKAFKITHVRMVLCALLYSSTDLHHRAPLPTFWVTKLRIRYSALMLLLFRKRNSCAITSNF